MFMCVSKFTLGRTIIKVKSNSESVEYKKKETDLCNIYIGTMAGIRTII